MHMRIFLLTAITIGMAGCENLTRPNMPGWLRASVSGAISGTYEGDGNFLVQTDRREGPREMFSLDSRTNSPRHQSFAFFRQNGTRPVPGRYPLEVVGPHNRDGDRFYAGYQRTGEVTEEYYTATSGWVEITESSKERVAGTFYLVGKLHCTNEPKPCAPSWDPPVDAPEIEVTGSFSAIPDDLRVDW